MNNHLFTIGIAAIVLLLIGLRRFHRRGLGGLQHFDNYFVALTVTAIEWLLKWAAILAIIHALIKIIFD